MKYFLFIIILLTCSFPCIFAQPIPVGTVMPTREAPVHDPVMIKQQHTWYIFHTE